MPIIPKSDRRLAEIQSPLGRQMLRQLEEEEEWKRVRPPGEALRAAVLEYKAVCASLRNSTLFREVSRVNLDRERLKEYLSLHPSDKDVKEALLHSALLQLTHSVPFREPSAARQERERRIAKVEERLGRLDSLPTLLASFLDPSSPSPAFLPGVMGRPPPVSDRRKAHELSEVLREREEEEG
ncbi:hypothetical protein JCM8547_006051 [Rhodosporidiobolus lusitaniae]